MLSFCSGICWEQRLSKFYNLVPGSQFQVMKATTYMKQQMNLDKSSPTCKQIFPEAKVCTEEKLCIIELFSFRLIRLPSPR
jgi:hypothetical protein